MADPRTLHEPDFNTIEPDFTFDVCDDEGEIVARARWRDLKIALDEHNLDYNIINIGRIMMMAISNRAEQMSKKAPCP